MARFEQTPKEEKLEIVPEAEAGFDYRAALNNKDFLSFLAEHADAADLDLRDEANLETIERRYKTYEQKEFLKTNLPSFYKEELEPRFDIEIDKENLAALEDFLEHEALIRPTELKERFENLGDLFRYRQENAELEAKIIELGGEAGARKARRGLEAEQGALEKEKGAAESATGTLWFLNPKNWELVQDLFKIQDREVRRGARKKTKEDRLGYFAKLDKEIDSKETRAEFLRMYPGVKRGREALQNAVTEGFFNNFEPARKIFETLSIQTAETLDMLIGDPDAETSAEMLEDAQEYLEKVAAGLKKVPAPEMEALPLEMFQKRINEKMGNLVIENVRRAVGEFKIGNQPLDALQDTLRFYLNREKLGSRDKATVKSLVASCVSNEIERLIQEKPGAYKQKSLLLKMLLEDIVHYE